MTREQALQELQNKYFEDKLGYMKVSEVRELINKIFDDFDANNKHLKVLVDKAENLVKDLTNE
jgi:hypothetical protein